MTNETFVNEIFRLEKISDLDKLLKLSLLAINSSATKIYHTLDGTTILIGAEGFRTIFASNESGTLFMELLENSKCNLIECPSEERTWEYVYDTEHFNLRDKEVHHQVKLVVNAMTSRIRALNSTIPMDWGTVRVLMDDVDNLQDYNLDKVLDTLWWEHTYTTDGISFVRKNYEYRVIDVNGKKYVLNEADYSYLKSYYIAKRQTEDMEVKEVKEEAIKG